MNTNTKDTPRPASATRPDCAPPIGSAGFAGTALEDLQALYGVSKWCQTCQHWEGYAADRLGFCPIFQKRTAADHGSQCTAHALD